MLIFFTSLYSNNISIKNNLYILIFVGFGLLCRFQILKVSVVDKPDGPIYIISLSLHVYGDRPLLLLTYHGQLTHEAEAPGELPWESASEAETPSELPWKSASEAETPGELPWESASEAEAPGELPWESASEAETPGELPWESASEAETPSELPWKPTSEAETPIELLWESTSEAETPSELPWKSTSHVEEITLQGEVSHFTKSQIYSM